MELGLLFAWDCFLSMNAHTSTVLSVISVQLLALSHNNENKLVKYLLRLMVKSIIRPLT